MLVTVAASKLISLAAAAVYSLSYSFLFLVVFSAFPGQPGIKLLTLSPLKVKITFYKIKRVDYVPKII